MNSVWVIMWIDDGDFSGDPQIEVFADEETAMEAFDDVIEELMGFHNINETDEFQHYIPYVAVTEGGDHVVMREIEVQQ